MKSENDIPDTVSLGSMIQADQQLLLENCPNYIKTGFDELDKNLGGGLTPNLFVLGAASSVGKSTFILQIAQNIAIQGHSVLFFSLEMPAGILAEKCLLRQMYSQYGAKKVPYNLFTNRQVMEKQLRSKEKKEILYQAIAEFQESAANIHVIDRTHSEAVFSFPQIRTITQKFKDKSPVVMVDYLQLLYRNDTGSITDKQTVDRNISDLWHLAHRFKIPVIVISSINRESYNGPMKNSAFKESGSIEFSADILLGLQLQKKQKETGTNRLLELIILKNRFGPSQCKISMKFNALYGLFEEMKSQNTENGEEQGDEQRI